MVQGVLIEDGCIVNTNPATGEVISRVSVTSEDQVNEIVQKANDALLSWSTCDAKTRMDFLRRGLKALGQHSDKLTTLMVQEMGKPLSEAQDEMEGAVQKDEYVNILGAAQEPVTHGTSVVVRQALGVVVVLSPWNFPVDEILLLALPALAAGNTVIVKPSEVTPECGATVVSSLASALPPNVIQVAQGDGTVGAQLVSHPSIHMVAMTGSTATGRRILSNAAPNLKRVVCELGGKDPMVVFEDADMSKAARDAVTYALCNTGQVCCSVERIYIAESKKDDFEKKVVECARDCKVGNGMDPGVTVGPMVSRLQRDHVALQVNSALEQGAKLLFKGEVPENGEASFYPVSVLSNITSDMDIFRTETFGPVVAISTFDGSEEEAIRLANDTEYGLAGSVYSQDLSKAKRVASRVRCGQVGINCWALENMNVACPW
jgi:acyl-CoA reductase-like NAD-dependent aldehyde dehydrogenase